MAKELTTKSYIDHHLTNFTCGKTPEGWSCDPHDVDQMGFWAFHVDSLFWSVFLGGLFIFIFKMAMPKNVIVDAPPTGLQNFVEMSIEFVEDNVQSLFGSIKNKLIAPLALTVFVWILLMRNDCYCFVFDSRIDCLFDSLRLFIVWAAGLSL